MNTDQHIDIEAFLLEAFDQNYELMRVEQGVALAPDVIEKARNHILFYWQKMKEVAERVTDTEVRLTLPQNETPKEREFTIEGVVDIVRDDDQTVMYDIKTHNVDFLRANLDQYEQQLNVYAYIWQTLRKEDLDEAAIICTDYPREVAEALESGDPQRLSIALEKWEPLIRINFNRQRVEQTIREFGEVVDKIEDYQFAPASLETLHSTLAGGNKRFAVHVCRNCDARFSCSSYRAYARQGRGQAETQFRKYYQDLDVLEDQENWRTANLDAAIDIDDLRADFGD
jgi:hypothetical protein